MCICRHGQYKRLLHVWTMLGKVGRRWRTRYPLSYCSILRLSSSSLTRHGHVCRSPQRAQVLHRGAQYRGDEREASIVVHAHACGEAHRRPPPYQQHVRAGWLAVSHWLAGHGLLLLARTLAACLCVPTLCAHQCTLVLYVYRYESRLSAYLPTYPSFPSLPVPVPL